MPWRAFPYLLFSPGDCPLPALRPSPRCATFPSMKLLHPSALRAVAFLLAAASPLLSPAAPKLVCDAPSHDFGEAVSPSIVEHDYLLRNDGDTSLEILSVRASCGCTAVNASQNVVRPGDTATIHATFTTSNRSGAQIKTITVTSNDPESPTTLLTLRGTIVKPLSANPAALYFGRLSDPASAAREVTLTGSEPFRVLSATTASPHLSATPDSDAPATVHRLSVDILPSMPVGPFGDTITVVTDLPVQPKILVPLTGSWNPAPAAADPAPEAAP